MLSATRETFVVSSQEMAALGELLRLVEQMLADRSVETLSEMVLEGVGTSINRWVANKFHPHENGISIAVSHKALIFYRR